MISVQEARAILSQNSHRGAVKNFDLQESLGLVLAENIHSPIDVPSFDNSAMDGYAMAFEGTRREWKVVESIQAGDTSIYHLKPGEAARIFTGAKMTPGADTVIAQELTESLENAMIRYSGSKIKTGSNVRLRGSQCKEGDLILEKETSITTGVIGLLASVGLVQVKAYAPPSVAYVVTGNELKEPGQTLAEGEIYNSNGPMLHACLARTGIRDITTLKASDGKEELMQVINHALERQDVLILSGGISVGDYDFVKECLENAGVKQLFYKVKQRPGKPLFVGKKEEKWIFALPGNPASVLSCFYQYVKPCLRYQMAYNQVWKPNAVLILSADYKKKPGFTFFVKGRRKENQVEILGAQQSFNLQSFSAADCLVELEEEGEVIKAGTPMNIIDL